MSLSFSTRKLVTFWALAIASSAAVLGQSLSPEGGEYAIVGSLPGDQTFPQAAINSAGGYLVWQDNAVTPKGLRIRAARLDGSFAVSDLPFPVSSAFKSKAAGDQKQPHVALLQDGGAVIVWQGGQPWRRIYARFLKTDGSFQTRDLLVSNQRKINQSEPEVATLVGGNVLVTWSSEGQDGSMQGIFARVLSAAGKPLGPEFQVNQTTLYNQRNPAVASLNDGKFVVVWLSELQRGPGSVDVYARVFDAAGAPVGGEFAVNTSPTNNCVSPAVAGSTQGGFAVVWGQNDNVVVPTPTLSSSANSGGILISAASLPSTTRSLNGWDIFARLFDGAGAALTQPFRCNQYTYGDQFAPGVSALGSNYMATWSGLSQTNEIGRVDPLEGVYGQYITGSGSPIFTNDLHVNATTLGRQTRPSAVSDGANRFLVIWSSLVPVVSRFDVDIFAQVYRQTAP